VTGSRLQEARNPVEVAVLSKPPRPGFTGAIKLSMGMGALKKLLGEIRSFIVREDGVTPLEWVAIGGVAVIMGVVMTWAVTANMSSSANYIESTVNSAASDSIASTIQ
jgi:hypothetical protein